LANQDLTALTEITTPLATDVVYVVNDPAGTKNPRKSTIANVLKDYDDQTSTLTNKTIDANGTGNAITNIGDAEMEVHTSTKITITAKGQLNSAIVYTDQANTMGDFLTTFKDNQLKINSPDDADGTTFVNSDQTANRNLTIPVLTGDRTIALLDEAQSFTAKQTFQDDSIDISNPADTFQYTLQAAAITADRILNLPLTTGTDTLATLGLAQTFTATQTFADVIHTGRHQEDKGTAEAAADAVTLDGDGNTYHITGTGTINHIIRTNWQPGSKITLIFDAAATVNHNTGGETGDEASIFLADATNRTMAANDTLTLVLDTTTRWLEFGGAGGAGGGGGGSDTPWTVNHDFATYYWDMEKQTKPSDPPTEESRYYFKTIDANNNGFFVLTKKNGSIVETQIA